MLHGGTSDKSLIVAGAGPSGLILAGSLARFGLAVTVVTPEPGRKWKPSYGLFEDQLNRLQDPTLRERVNRAIAGRYPSPLVWGHSGQARRLDRPYLRFCTDMLQSELVVRAKEASVTFREGRMTADQAQSAKELVIDATGRGLLPQAAPDAYQYAYGKWVRLEEEAFPNGEMSLMDYRDQRDAPASFLYAMQEEHPDFGRVLFVQETVVASAKPVAWDLLKSRLAKRLTQLPQVIEECGEEFCEIPLGRALPPLRPQLLAFGAAAGLVHPATGYQIAHALRMAEPLAESLSRSVHLPRRQRIAAAQDTLWPSSKRRAFKIYRWSASIMAELSPAEMTRFIDAFFASDEKSWRGFMDGTLEAREIFSLMAQVFSGSSLSLRTRLIGRAAKHGKLALQALSTQSGLSPLSPPTGRASP